MLYPTPEELSKGKYNRYVLVSATAKCARMVTDEYCKCRENAERQIANKETEKSIASMIKREIRDGKSRKMRNQTPLYRGIQYRRQLNQA